MYDSPEELLEKIQLGEDTSIEFKTIRFKGDRVDGPKRDDLADELAALANSHGGVIVFGVDDKTRDVVGIPLDRLDAVEQYTREICNESIQPPVLFFTQRMRLSNTEGEPKPILKVEIPRSLYVHKSPGGYFHRQGSSKRELRPDHLARLFQQRSQARLIRFDEQPVPNTSQGTLMEPLWRRYTTRSSDTAEVVLRKRGLLALDENGDVRASVAGLLTCCEQPEQFMPQAYIEAVRYRGVKQDSHYQTDAQRIRGPLDRQIDLAMAFYRRSQTVAAIKRPHRVEFPQFSERAVFEAVVNAVAHRDYSVYGSKIRFFMFDDRLELYSPGPLPNTVTLDSIALRQSTRNELIVSLLAETSVGHSIGDVGRNYYMERRGDGVPIILEESERHSGKVPVYRVLDEAELMLTIFSAQLPNQD